MSIKTLRKRIALVAVSALGVGLLSVAPASAAIAADSVTADTLYLGITRDTDGTVNANSGTTGVSSAMTQIGYITDTSATTQTTDTSAAIYATNQIRYATVYPNAKISFVAAGSATSADGLSVVVTGGTLSNLAATAAEGVTLAAADINGDFTAVTTDAAGQDVIYGVFNVSAAVGSVATITVYTGTNVTNTARTSGTAVAQYQLTVAAASLSGTYSATDSTVTQQACLASGDTAGTVAYDTTTRCRNGYTGSIYVDLEDGFGAELTTGTISATASNNALITNSATASTGSSVNGATSSFTSVASDGEVWLYVKQPTANTAGSSTVTISWNGTVVGTKTITWEGDIATLAIDTANSSANFSTNQADTTANIGAAGVVYVAKDAAKRCNTQQPAKRLFSYRCIDWLNNFNNYRR